MLSKELSTISLENHFEALLVLSKQDEPINQNKLAELMQIDKSRIANMVYELETRGLIYTKRNPADRREHFVYLSQTALDSLDYIEKAIEKTNHLAESGIEPEKLMTFFEVSAQIENNLRARIAV